MQEALRRLQASQPLAESFQTAKLLTASATTGWLDWIHGELWLLPQGFLRIPLGLWVTIEHGMGPTINVQAPETLMLNQQEINQLIASKANLWVPREHTARAYLHHGLMTDRLRLELSDGRSIKLLWLPQDQALQPLQAILQEWLGNNLLID